MHGPRWTRGNGSPAPLTTQTAPSCPSSRRAHSCPRGVGASWIPVTVLPGYPQLQPENISPTLSCRVAPPSILALPATVVYPPLPKSTSGHPPSTTINSGQFSLDLRPPQLASDSAKPRSFSGRRHSSSAVLDPPSASHRPRCGCVAIPRAPARRRRATPAIVACRSGRQVRRRDLLRRCAGVAQHLQDNGARRECIRCHGVVARLAKVDYELPEDGKPQGGGVRRSRSFNHPILD